MRAAINPLGEKTRGIHAWGLGEVCLITNVNIF